MFLHFVFTFGRIRLNNSDQSTLTIHLQMVLLFAPSNIDVVPGLGYFLNILRRLYTPEKSCARPFYLLLNSNYTGIFRGSYVYPVMIQIPSSNY